MDTSLTHPTEATTQDCHNEQEESDHDNCDDTTEIPYDSFSSSSSSSGEGKEDAEEEDEVAGELQQTWLKELTQCAELETLSILYVSALQSFD
jgi:hypothetical protein